MESISPLWQIWSFGEPASRESVPEGKLDWGLLPIRAGLFGQALNPKPSRQRYAQQEDSIPGGMSVRKPGSRRRLFSTMRKSVPEEKAAN
jgi:hypothetical protein